MGMHMALGLRGLSHKTCRPSANQHPRAAVRAQSGNTPPRSSGATPSEPPESRQSPQRKDASSLDVLSTVVETVYRVRPDTTETAGSVGGSTGPVRILFVSESGVCRAPLAAAAATSALDAAGLAGQVEFASACSRDYNVGEAPDPLVIAAAEAMGLPLLHTTTATDNNGAEGAVTTVTGGARVFDERTDIVRNDLVLTMDKFTAADVLREVSVFDTIDPGAKYSSRVRLLGEFRPVKRGRGRGVDADDIDDPLYGNLGGETEAEAVQECAEDIAACCKGLVDHLARLLKEGEEGAGLRTCVAAWLTNADAVEWMVPPMLQPR